MVRIGAIAVFAVLAALVAGCTNPPADPASSLARSSSPPSSTAAATSTPPTSTRNGPLTTGPGVQPGEKPPVLSAEGKQHTAAGALTFGEYYMRALDWSIATSDPYLLTLISSPRCTACTRGIKGLTSLSAKGGRVSGGRITVRSSKLATGSFKVKSDFVIEIDINEAAVVLVRPSAPPTTTGPALHDDTSLVFVSWVKGRWRIMEVGAP